jgi:hypothetical protein
MKYLLKKGLALGVSLLLISNIFISAASAATTQVTSDIKGHWAEKTMSEWVTKGLLSGYSDGKINPDKEIKRGEFVALVNRAFQLKEATTIQFSDLSPTDWVYNDISVAVKAGYLKGYSNGTAAVNTSISRQESAVMLSNLLKLEPNDSLPFTDSKDFSKWSKGAAGALSAKGIIKGYSDGTFRPNHSITRAEAVVIINQALTLRNSPVKQYNTAGTYGPASGTETINGNVEVTAAGVTLQNLVINGNLLLGESIGNGDATLNNVTVNGQTTVKGGGENSIHISNSVLLTILVNKADGTVRIVAEGTTMVKSVTVQSSAIVQESGVTGSGFSNVEMAKELPADSKVTLHGTFDKVNVVATRVSITIPEGSIQQLSVDKNAASSTITVDQLASVIDMVLDSAVKVLGQGSVGKVTANEGSAGSSFEKTPTTVDGSAKGSVTTATPSPAPSGTSSGGSGGTDTVTKSSYADLEALSIGNLTLYQKDNHGHKGTEGFNKNVSYYVAETPEGYVSANQLISIVPADSKATVQLGIYDRDNNHSIIRPLSPMNDTTYNLTLQPKSALNLSVMVIAEDQKTIKYYSVDVTWERTFKEKIQLKSGGIIEVRGLSDGDLVRVYQTESDSSFIAEKISNDEYLSIIIPHATFTALAKPTGSLWFSLKKAGQTEVVKIKYDYDLNPLTNIIDGSKIDIRTLTAEDLSETHLPLEYLVKGQGLHITVKSEDLDPSFAAQAKYVHFDTHSYAQFVPTLEDTKGMNYDYFYISLQNNASWSSIFNDTLPMNFYTFIYFYDEQKNYIGHYTRSILVSSPYAPLLSNVTTSASVGQDINATSSKAGTLYLVPRSTTYYDQGRMISAAKKSVSATANAASAIDTTGVTPGTYVIYAVDSAGNVSLPSQEITIEAAAPVQAP